MSEPREIFPVRTVTNENVADFRPRKGDPEEPELTEEEVALGKDGVDSALESASSETSTQVTAPPALTLGVQIPAAPANGQPSELPPAS